MWINTFFSVFYYDGGIFSYCIGGLSCNHAVVLVGYNNEQLTLKNRFVQFLELQNIVWCTNEKSSRYLGTLKLKFYIILNCLHF